MVGEGPWRRELLIVSFFLPNPGTGGEGIYRNYTKIIMKELLYQDYEFG